MKKYLPFIPLVLWIFLYPMIGGIIYWQTNYQNALFVSLIGIIAIFNLVWYLIKLNYINEDIDLVSTVGNLIIFNFPAYFLIAYYYKDKNKHRKKAKPISSNLNYAAWELAELAEKNPKKYQKLIKNETENKLLDQSLLLKQKVYQGFGIYLLMNIYQANPEIVDTFKIINLFKEEIEDETNFSKNLLEFKEVDLNLFFDLEDLVKLEPDPKTKIYEILVNANSNEIYLEFKENRSRMQTEAKKLLQTLK